MMCLRKTKLRARFALLCLVLVLAACSKKQRTASPEVEEQVPSAEATAKQQVAAPVDKPKRIILLIGDGMGVSSITAASYAKGQPLSMLGSEKMGLMTTHSHEFVTTDSAASASAIATGHKTHFEGVSVTPGTTREQENEPAHHVETVLERAQKRGWKTGLVATSRIAHATPAAFAAHRTYRRDYEAIAGDLFEADIDVLLGGGPRLFTGRADEVDLVEGFRDKGYTVALDAEGVHQASEEARRLVGFPHDPDFPPAGDPSRTMSLAQMTRAALQVLDRDNDDGFFLMVEGSQIDWRGHSLDGPGVVAEMLDFDEAVAAALRYAAGRDDTLVVTTSDHETGGMSVLDPIHVERYAGAMGGYDALAGLTGWPEGVDKEEPPVPVAYQALGADESGRDFGPPHVEDARFATAFSHLSQASRSYCDSSRRFSAVHTPELVPVFAEGKAAAYVAAVDDNAELGRRLLALVDAEQVQAKAPPASQAAFDGDSQPKNVILMVADGFGIGALTAAHYGHGELAMRSLPVKGLLATHAADLLVADSASGATALATGKKTRVGALGMVTTDDGELEPAVTLLERAEARGMATGLVTTTTLTHATPASFYAHQPDRKDEARAADSFVSLPDRIEGSDGIDVAFGAGAQIFGSARLAALQERGVVVETSWSDQVPTGKQVMRFMGGRGMSSATDRLAEGGEPSLRQMTAGALTALSRRGDGFVLIVEGGQIDWAQHALAQNGRLIDEVADFDAAVAEAYRFARRDQNTLLVVTSDHDHTTTVIDNHYGFDGCGCAAAAQCGGDHELQMLPTALDRINHNQGLDDARLQGKYAPPEIALQYAWLAKEGAPRAGISAPHSANFVPLFAYGPQADKLEGFGELDQVGQVLLEAVDQ